MDYMDREHAIALYFYLHSKQGQPFEELWLN